GAKIDLFVDFENAIPTVSERDVYDNVMSILQHIPQLVKEIKAYPGATKEIKDAIQNPKNPAIQDNTWNIIIQSARQLKKFWQFSLQLDRFVVPQLLSALCNTTMTPYQHLESQQALAKLFAETLHFVLLFDD
ncbi:Rac1-binding domain-containing protein, partial [Salmonella sp. s51228]|uniref:Rac1-binding domain-containing protein n=1 Tax=Salmonella sp. s51228 TaxID=3159652 RepID=UPI00397F6AEA